MYATNDRKTALMAGILFAALANTSIAQPPQDPRKPAHSEAEQPKKVEVPTTPAKTKREVAPGILFLEPDTYTLDVLRKRVAHATERDIITHPQDRAQWEQTSSITLDRPIRTDAQGALTLFSRMLCSQSFLLTKLEPNGSVLEIVSSVSSTKPLATHRAELKTPAEVLATPDLQMLVTVQWPVKHLNCQQTVNSLRPFLAQMSSGQNNFMQMGALGSSILLMGMQDQVARVLKQLEAADIETKEEINLRDRIQALEAQVRQLQGKSPVAPPAARPKRKR